MIASSRTGVDRRGAIALLALCTALRVLSLVRPCLSDDEATYAVVGRELLAGRVLYRDVVDHKPPAIYATNAVTQWLGGPTGGMLLLHLLLIVVVWATGLLLARLVRRHAPGDAGERAAPFAALLWIVFTTTLLDFDALAANCELFMMLPVVASVVVLGEANGRATRALAAGALVGVAMLYKYQAGIQLPLYVAAWGWAHRAQPKRALVGAAALVAGFGLVVAAAIAVLWGAGGLGAAYFWFRFNFAYIDTGSSHAAISHALLHGALVVGGALLLYVLGLRGAWRAARRGNEAERFAVAWLAVSVAAVTVGGRFFGHYFHQITAPLAVLAAPAAERLWRRRPALLLAGTAVPAVVFFALGLGHDRMMAWYGQPDPDYGRVVAWLDAHGTRDDGVCIWGNSPVLYFDADRPLGCRFVFANYLTGLSPSTEAQVDPTIDTSANVVPESWDMLDADLAARRPRYLIDASPGNVGFYGKYPPEHFPRLEHALDCDYRAVDDVAGMRIFERLDVSRCP